MDQIVRIPARDGKTIHARAREVPGAPVVVIAHGMTGHMDGRLELGFARMLEREGYSSLRFNAYDWAEDARDLCDMGLREHLDDLGAVIDRASGMSGSVVALGHSFGGMCIVLRGPAGLKGAVLWDPASQRVWAGLNREIATFDAERREYVQRERVAVIYSERMLQEVEQADAAVAATAFDVPMLVVSSPQWPHMNEAGREYAERAPRAERVEIPGSDHNFTDDVSEASLFATTLAWLQRTVPVTPG